jgi:hypothetical protein
MQADVTLGVIIAALAPPYGAAIVILFRLQSCVSLHIRQYNCIIDTHNRMLHKNEKSIFRYMLSPALSTYACTLPNRHAPVHNFHHAACPPYRLFHYHSIDAYQYSGAIGRMRSIDLCGLLQNWLYTRCTYCKRKMLIVISSLMFLMPCLYSLAGETTIKRRT